MKSVLLFVWLLVSTAVALRNNIRPCFISKANHMKLHAKPRKNEATPRGEEDESYNYFGKQHDLPGSKYKKVSVMKYEDTVYVNIRKYIPDKDNGKLVASKTGISLSAEQWEALKALAPTIDDDLLKLGRLQS